MIRLKKLVLLTLVLTAALLPGCVQAPNGRAKVSLELARRTGHTLSDSKAGQAMVPPGVEFEDGLSEAEAISFALWNNSSFQETLTKLELSRADLLQAGLLSNPTFSVLFPLGPKQLEFAATFPLEAVWLRPRRVAIAKLDHERVAQDLVLHGLDLVRDVRAGFSDLQLARDHLQLARQSIDVWERIAEISESRHRAGEASALEAERARVDVIRARDDTSRAEKDLLIAQERLLGLLGLLQNPISWEFAAPVSPPPLRWQVGELEQKAFAARPELRAAELAVEAAAKRAGLSRTEIFALSGIIDANGSGKEGFEMGPGMQLPIPIFNQNQAGRARADAEVQRAAWHQVDTRQRIAREVREAYARCQQASRSLQKSDEQIVPALEGLLRQSEKAYELGELSPLALQETAGQLILARSRQAEAVADLRRAWAELERSVGSQLVDSRKGDER
jgi:cobalt-zinc-cadmium efflux system outer membrane protein